MARSDPLPASEVVLKHESPVEQLLQTRRCGPEEVVEQGRERVSVAGRRSKRTDFILVAPLHLRQLSAVTAESSELPGDDVKVRFARETGPDVSVPGVPECAEALEIDRRQQRRTPERRLLLDPRQIKRRTPRVLRRRH